MTLSTFARLSLVVTLAALCVSPFVPKLVSADIQNCIWNTTCSPGTLQVYVTVNQNPQNAPNRAPSDFTVTVNGQVSSPVSFPGSLSGTTVSVAGPYSVNVLPIPGYQASYSTGCNNSVYNGGSATCIVTMTPTGGYTSVVQPYPYPYTQLPLQCSTPTPTVNLGQVATFTANSSSGGPFNWATPFQTYPGIGPTLNVAFPTTGVQLVTVTSGSQTATCAVNVVASGAPAPISSVAPGIPADYPPQVSYQCPAPAPSPALTSNYIPKLPNTGYAPLSSWQLALMLVSLLSAGVLVLPYVRKAALIALN